MTIAKKQITLILFLIICVFSLSKVQSQRNPSGDLPVLGVFTQNLTFSWDSNVGCSEYEGKDTQVSFEQISMDDCVTVCGNSIINYTIEGNIPNGIDVTWQVNGGIITDLFNNNQSIEVVWSNSGSGLITVDLTNSEGETLSKSQCITIIEAPESRIELLPLQDTSICLNDSVQFLNDSFDNNDSELILYEWVFTSPGGDLYYSTEFEPNFQFDQPGDWEIKMRTTNACGCVSSFDEISFSVSESIALTIDCPTVICENETMEYSINGYEDCGEFEWQVQGGDIRSTDDNTITIDWNLPDETVDGFGIISFNQSNCEGECTGWITERIPIILNNGDDVFTGPEEICLGE